MLLLVRAKDAGLPVQGPLAEAHCTLLDPLEIPEVRLGTVFSKEPPYGARLESASLVPDLYMRALGVSMQLPAPQAYGKLAVVHGRVFGLGFAVAGHACLSQSIGHHPARRIGPRC